MYEHIHSLMEGACAFSFPLQIEVIECITLSITDPYPPPWIRSLVLTKEDEKALLSGSWLSASHVSAVHKLLHKAFPNQEGLNDTSILAEKLIWPSKPEHFVQIIYVPDYHWACLSNKFCAPGSVDLYDSLHTLPDEDGGICIQACAILQSQASSVTINVINVLYQSGVSDCGLFAIAMAYDLCRGIDPFVMKYDQSRMREHLHVCFKQGKIEHFPCHNNGSSGRKRRVVAQVTNKIFCICRLPEIPPMASCDSCGTWYHQDCVHIPTEVFDNEDTIWICDSCKYHMFVNVYTGTCVLYMDDLHRYADLLLVIASLASLHNCINLFIVPIGQEHKNDQLVTKVAWSSRHSAANYVADLESPERDSSGSASPSPSPTTSHGDKKGRPKSTLRQQTKTETLSGAVGKRCIFWHVSVFRYAVWFHGYTITSGICVMFLFDAYVYTCSGILQATASSCSCREGSSLYTHHKGYWKDDRYARNTSQFIVCLFPCMKTMCTEC